MTPAPAAAKPAPAGEAARLCPRCCTPRALGARLWLFGTPFFGLIFLGFQVYEFATFVREGLTLQVNLFGASFFVLTGFHGAHVSVGVVWLLTLWTLALRNRLTRADALIVEIAGLYWHFVDIVWIFLFPLVYLS